jgi:hypothetical protein
MKELSHFDSALQTVTPEKVKTKNSKKLAFLRLGSHKKSPLPDKKDLDDVIDDFVVE